MCVLLVSDGAKVAIKYSKTRLVFI